MAIALDENTKTFVVYIVILSAPTMQVHPFLQAQIGLFLANKAPTKVLPKYLDYDDVFLFDFAKELPENTGINEHVIELVKGK